MKLNLSITDKNEVANSGVIEFELHMVHPNCTSNAQLQWIFAGIDGKTLIDFDRQYLSKQLDRAVADIKNMTYFQSKVVEEKNLLERKLFEATDDLQTKEKCMEDLKEEIMHLISDKQAAETEKSCRDSQTPMHNYLQELWRENLEKSRVMIALQGKLILANEQVCTLPWIISRGELLLLGNFPIHFKDDFKG